MSEQEALTEHTELPAAPGQLRLAIYVRVLPCNLAFWPVLQAASEATAVAAALSELEGLVSQLVGVGIYDLKVKDWRRRLRGRKTVDELCE